MMLQFLQAYFPHADAKLLAAMADAYPAAKIKYRISVGALCLALGQVKLESTGLTHLTENLNYSAERLQEVFDMDEGVAEKVAHDPQAIAELVYGTGHRGKELGNETSEDGWTYRGRGPLQITGRWMYAAMEAKTGLSLVSNPDAALEPKNFWTLIFGFFMVKGCMTTLQAPLTQETIEHLTRIINGGLNNLAERLEFTEDAARKLSRFHAA